MKLLIEDYRYSSTAATDLLRELEPLHVGKQGHVSLVGYYYSRRCEDLVFIVPKAILNQQDKVLSRYDPEKLVDTSKAYDEGYITKEDFDFLFHFSVWVYRALQRFQEESNYGEQQGILSTVERVQTGDSGNTVRNSFLDLIMEVIDFYQSHRDFIAFTIKELTTGFNRINWQRTVNRCGVIICDNAPYYLRPYNKKRCVNGEEELLIIYHSILHHLHRAYGFSDIDVFSLPLLPDEELDSYLRGYGVRKLEEIRNRYYSDTYIRLWNICYRFFRKAQSIHAAETAEDYLIAEEFHIIFEKMVDAILSEPNEMISKLHLKEQRDGKIVDHIYAYAGVLNPDAPIYYIGDSKYYKAGHLPDSYSVTKQFTYAKNVIQENMNLYNNSDSSATPYFYFDPLTEGYNITPNFFISAYISDTKSFADDELRCSTHSYPHSFHHRNRLFDRDTLHLQHYRLNFLYIIMIYASHDMQVRRKFRSKMHRTIRSHFAAYLGQKYTFYKISPLCATDNQCHEGAAAADEHLLFELVRKKHFHRIYGKVLKTERHSSTLFLALEKGSCYENENTDIIAELETDFRMESFSIDGDDL